MYSDTLTAMSDMQYYDRTVSQPSTPFTGHVIGGRGLDTDGYTQFTGLGEKKLLQVLQENRSMAAHFEGGIVFQFMDSTLDEWKGGKGRVDSNTVQHCISNLFCSSSKDPMEKLRILGISLVNIPSHLDEIDPPSSPFVSKVNPQGPNMISILTMGTTSIVNTGNKLIRAFEHVFVAHPLISVLDSKELNAAIQKMYSVASSSSVVTVKRARFEKNPADEKFVIPTLFSVSDKVYSALSDDERSSVQLRYLGQARQCANPGEKFDIYINPQWPLANSLQDIQLAFGPR